MSLLEPFKISQACRNKFCSHIIDSSAPRIDFYFLIILSSSIVSLGLLIDNVILVIGGMLVTPLLSPIMAISLGMVISDHKVLIRSVKVFLLATIYSFLVALIIGFVAPRNLNEIGLIDIMKPSLFGLLVAIIAGLAASYTWVKPELNVNLAGIAVTVTLLPPLVATGLTIANGEWLLFRNTLNTFILNVFGIIVASLVVFSLMDFYKAKKMVIAEVKEEEKEFKKKKTEKQ